jgi:hypothetical protein
VTKHFAGAVVSLIALCCQGTLYAQDDSDKINSNLGMSMSLPVSTTAKYASIGWGATGGVGYNFNQHHSIIGEFLWNQLYATNYAMAPINVAAPSGGVNGQSDIYAVTGNYRYEVRGKKLGTYFVGGAGWYYRYNHLSRPVTVPAGTGCTPALVWWGGKCSSGSVTVDQKLGSYGSNVFGGNVGVGFTVNVGEPSYRLYVESRYHYAPTQNIRTQLLDLTVGIRY